MISKFSSRYASLRELSAREVGRPHARRRLKNIIQGQLDARIQPIYDFWSVAVNTATRQENLFTIPFGGQYTGAGVAAINKTLFHTTMLQAGGLDAPKKLLVKNIAVLFQANIHPTDLNLAVTNYLLTFSTLGKTYWQGHVQKCPAGGGAYFSGAGTLTAPAVLTSAANGWPTAGNTAPIVDDVPAVPGAQINPILGVLLEQQQPFAVQVDPTLAGGGTGFTTQNSSGTPTGTVGTGITGWVYLEGILLVAIV